MDEPDGAVVEELSVALFFVTQFGSVAVVVPVPEFCSAQFVPALLVLEFWAKAGVRTKIDSAVLSARTLLFIVLFPVLDK